MSAKIQYTHLQNQQLKEYLDSGKKPNIIQNIEKSLGLVLTAWSTFPAQLAPMPSPTTDQQKLFKEADDLMPRARGYYRLEYVAGGGDEGSDEGSDDTAGNSGPWVTELAIYNTALEHFPPLNDDTHDNKPDENWQELRYLKKLELCGNALNKIVLKDNLEQWQSGLMDKNQVPCTVEIYAKTPNLIYLSSTSSKIKEFRLKNDSPALKNLSLNNNQITALTLPPSLLKADREPALVLNLKDNPFEGDLAEAVVAGPRDQWQSLLSYMQKYTASEIRTQQKLKIILLGNTGAGKTLLGDALCGRSQSQAGPSTHGILFEKIPNFKNSGVTVYVYDFGGQDYYHSSHYAFFGNALYLLMWANWQEQYGLGQEKKREIVITDQQGQKQTVCVDETTYPLSYWLGSVRYHIENNPNAQQGVFALLLQNCQVLDASVKSELLLDQKSLRDRYDFIKDFRVLVPERTEGAGGQLSFVDLMPDNSPWVKLLKNFAQPFDVTNDTIKLEEYIENLKKTSGNGHPSVIIKLIDLASQEKGKTHQNVTIEQQWGSDLAQFPDILKTGIRAFLFQYPLEEIAGKNDKKIQEFTSKYPVFSQYALIDVQKLCDWIYAVLSIEAILGEDGYFSREDAKNRIADAAKGAEGAEGAEGAKTIQDIQDNDNMPELSFLIEYMLYHQIIFEAPRQPEDNQKLYFAPNLLRSNKSKTKTEKLFTQHAFDKPIVQYQFNEFIHSNILAKLINEFKDRLVETPAPPRERQTLGAKMSFEYVLFRKQLVLLSAKDNPSPQEKHQREYSQKALAEDGVLHTEVAETEGVSLMDHEIDQEEPLLLIELMEENELGVVATNPHESTRDHDLSIEVSKSEDTMDPQDVTAEQLKKNFAKFKEEQVQKEELRSKSAKIQENVGKNTLNEAKPQKLLTMKLRPYKTAPSDEQFLRDVMDFIEKVTQGYQKTKWLETPSGSYVPESVVLAPRTDERGRVMPLFEYHHVLYRRGDFKLFLGKEDKLYPMQKIFISYSQEDTPYVTEFRKHLAQLKTDGLIDLWYDGLLKGGQEWDKKIRSEIDQCNIMCFMVSHHLLANDFVMQKELKMALERKKDLLIVPIILEACHWTSHSGEGLAKYNALPYKATPIKDFADHAQGWFLVVEVLKWLIYGKIELNSTIDLCRSFKENLTSFHETLVEQLLHATQPNLNRQFLDYVERITQKRHY